ncbi:dTMP kinase [Afipia felis]|jgi:dTMP kinase|uniref:Thymidylate kinase n=2 Tax=Afipia felis TaxID=1035 RepID=A0A380W835_AFIFE|nr:dTMP kinase [Afipia felis]EKS28250.1 thymidylate kinase [Afipia felis ATCC 53690]SUU76959.1 Thymidylate kinase [Afipia felis]SUU85026.1 Thymidylate kinase [Afipia felis]
MAKRAKKSAPRKGHVIGRFITFEGGEGSGKSTQIQMLADHLKSEGIETLVTREPGGSPGAEIIRHLLLSGVGKLLGADAETLLFAAARDDHVHQVIKPALEKGAWVLCDRFTDSTAAYQGAAGKVDAAFIRALTHATIGKLEPDLTFILDVPVAVGLQRAIKRRGRAVADRFEGESLSFHESLRDAYRKIAEENSARCVVIDANNEPAEVAERIWRALQDRLPTCVSVGAGA